MDDVKSYIKQERHRIIMREINLHNKVLSSDLSLLMNASDDTIRRDLKELAELGKLVKIHGGAASKSFLAPFSSNSEVYALQEKKVIANKVQGLLKNNMVILTEGGTTILEFAKLIPAHFKATFYTISPQVAIVLSEHTNIQVITIGGLLNKNANLHVGATLVRDLAEIKADIGLLGANAFSAEEGLTDMDWDVVQAKKAIIQSSKKVAVLSISEKLNTAQRFRICKTQEIDYLITELATESLAVSNYKAAGMEVL